MSAFCPSCRAPAAPGALIGRRLADGLDLQLFHLRAVAVALQGVRSRHIEPGEPFGLAIGRLLPGTQRVACTSRLARFLDQLAQIGAGAFFAAHSTV